MSMVMKLRMSIRRDENVKHVAQLRFSYPPFHSRKHVYFWKLDDQSDQLIRG